MTTPTNKAKLGKREKSLLLLMLKSDDPPGSPNPIWFDIYREYEMNYSALPKKYQNKFREERMFRQSIRRLTKRGFIKPLLVTQQAFSLDTDPRGYGYLFYSLTPLGRLTAEKLLPNNTPKPVSNDVEKIEKTLAQLRIEDNTYVTADQIRDALWQQQQFANKRFDSRVDFDKYWNNTKLGLMLKKYTFDRTRIGEKDGRRKYLL